MKGKKQKGNKKNKKEDSDNENNDSNNNSENSSDNEEEINVKYLKGKYYIFAKENKKKVVTIPKSSKSPGTQLEIDNFTKGGSKQFEIEPLENGMYAIKSCISGLYLKIKEGFKVDEVVQDEFDENSNEFKWIFETKEENQKGVYIKSAVGGEDCEDFYMIVEGYEPKSHAKIVIGPFDETQKFLLCRKV